MVSAGDEKLILRADLSPLGRAPHLLGEPDYITLDKPERPRFRTEAWRLTNGDVVVIVTEGGGLSLANAVPNIAHVIEQRWNPSGTAASFTIIEDWGTDRFMGDRFRIMSGDGQSVEFDRFHWAPLGVVLPDDDEF